MPPSGEVRGGMGLSAASPPRKALPGAGSPRPAGEMRWRVVGVRCHPCPAARVPAFCALEPAGLCGNGTPLRVREHFRGWGVAAGEGCSPWSIWALVGYGLSCRLNFTSEQIV